MEKSLKTLTLKGVSWSFVDNIAGLGISFLVGLVLAQLLSPSEFWIIGIITIFIAISDSIVDSGFSNALIRKIDAEKKDYDTVFIFNFDHQYNFFIFSTLHFGNGYYFCK